MSRWREMMMDYGQIFGSQKSGNSASSNVFTINSDLKDKRNTDLQLRRTLEVHFRPLFQRFVYGGEKIACHDLRRVLHDPEYRDRLPADKVHELADVADFNKGKAISYNEFISIVLNQLPLDDIASMGSLNELSSFGNRPKGDSCAGGILPLVCRNTVDQKTVEDKMQGYRCFPPPFFMLLVSLVQILVYIVFNAKEGVTTDPLGGVALGNSIMYSPVRRREAWRWVTYCFLHQGYVDLIFNVVIQLVIGVPLEMMFSWWRVAIVYVAGVIVGSCGHSITDHYVGLVGAAGGSYAILAAHVVTLLSNWKRYNTDLSESRTKRLVCSLGLRLILIAIVVVSQVGLAIYRRFYMDVANGMKFGFAAHVGGIIAGATLSDAFLTDNQRGPFKGGAAFLGLFTFLFFLGVTVVLNITWWDYPEEDYS